MATQALAASPKLLEALEENWQAEKSGAYACRALVQQDIEMNDAEARELLSLYYQVRRIPEEDADHIVEEPARNPEQAVGAFIPIVPFSFLSGYAAVVVSAAVSLLAHYSYEICRPGALRILTTGTTIQNQSRRVESL
jgi:hypothetical protein